MTREAFIRKYLGNRDYLYTRENRDLMRDDLDLVIKAALLDFAKKYRYSYQNSEVELIVDNYIIKQQNYELSKQNNSRT